MPQAPARTIMHAPTAIGFMLHHVDLVEPDMFRDSETLELSTSSSSRRLCLGLWFRASGFGFLLAEVIVGPNAYPLLAR